MKIEIDTEAGVMIVDGERLPLYGDASFRALSDLWVKVGWNQKYSYTFSWLGVPIIQLPEDMIRYQEVVARLKPDVIVETGVAHGGSAIFSASLCRPHRQRAGRRGRHRDPSAQPARHRGASAGRPRDAHRGLLDGAATIEAVKAHIRPGESVLVVLDSNHSYAHVRDELEAYAPLVTPDSYIVATDGIMRDLTDAPRGAAGWRRDNPADAARDFAAAHPGIRLEQPAWPFNESTLTANVTHWPDAWLRRAG